MTPQQIPGVPRNASEQFPPPQHASHPVASVEFEAVTANSRRGSGNFGFAGTRAASTVVRTRDTANTATVVRRIECTCARAAQASRRTVAGGEKRRALARKVLYRGFRDERTSGWKEENNVCDSIFRNLMTSVFFAGRKRHQNDLNHHAEPLHGGTSRDALHRSRVTLSPLCFETGTLSPSPRAFPRQPAPPPRRRVRKPRRAIPSPLPSRHPATRRPH